MHTVMWVSILCTLAFDHEKKSTLHNRSHPSPPHPSMNYIKPPSLLATGDKGGGDLVMQWIQYPSLCMHSPHWKLHFPSDHVALSQFHRTKPPPSWPPPPEMGHKDSCLCEGEKHTTTAEVWFWHCMHRCVKWHTNIKSIQPLVLQYTACMCIIVHAYP